MNPENMPLISFPWLFASELGKIATSSNSIRQVDVLQAQAASHRKKQVTVDPELLVGEVETDEGVVTHYGELLKLSFDAQVSTPEKGLGTVTEGGSKSTAEAEAEAKEIGSSTGEKESGTSPKQGGNEIMNADHRARMQPQTLPRSASQSPPVVESYQWRQMRRTD